MALFSDVNIDEIVENAGAKIAKIRRNLLQIYQIIAQFVADKTLIISDASLLIGAWNVETTEIYRFNIYVDEPFTLARELAQLLAKVAKYVTVKHVLFDEEIEIAVDSEIIATFYRISNPQIINYIPFINKQIADVSNIHVIPPEVEIINTYHKLYSIEAAKDRDKFAQVEPLLFEMLTKRTRKIKGNAEIPDLSNLSGTRLFRAMIAILADELPGDDAIIVGEVAYQKLSDNAFSSDQLRFISRLEIREFAEKIRRIFAENGGSSADLRISWLQQKIYLPFDSRLRIYRVYAEIGEYKRRICTVYNSATYEIVPYVKRKDVPIGSRFVLLRFIFIEIWQYKIMRKIEAIDVATMENAVEELLEIAENVRAMTAEETLHYTGVYEPSADAKKLANIERSRGKTWFYF
ncbi:MAG TPA: hypothetical protein VI821_00180 [Candidatus Paceibacterota bacterium]